ncbi:MAG: tetrathionate reductase family octaheme c-type cytochrome [bacterium]|nr:tetrathionate reductase family octaheme c-type cytochrome [bacterium]MDT8367438.1 tetrathionate reductase family octaheme c-type cytochrome [bacterium]
MKISIPLTIILALVAVMAVQSPATASEDHTEYLEGPFRTGEEVTAACLDCHEEQAEHFLETSHYKWKGLPRTIDGLEKSKKEYGKANLINNFCVDIEASRAFCTKCHAGYGWEDGADPQMDVGRIDCLVCHASKGHYQKSMAGLPDPKMLENGRMDLLEAARSVGPPDRKNCGVCHFFAGGGDAVKHGDLDSSLIKPKPEHDIHMGGSTDMTCQECHITRDHRIAGASTFMATNDGRVACEDCHRDPHRDSNSVNLLNIHTRTVACQTCHIPFFSKGQATKMSWDWSTVGQDIEPAEQFGKETFARHKGTFVWARDVAPRYAWYNGKTRRYLKGDKVKDTSGPVIIAQPVGAISDKGSRIYPFKVFTGKQPMDSKLKHLLIFQSYGGLWSDYDWENALQAGAESSGLPYSGEFTFVSTVSYGSINHEVAPKEQALDCGDCHFGRDKRMDWEALGYEGDPMRVGVRKAK